MLAGKLVGPGPGATDCVDPFILRLVSLVFRRKVEQPKALAVPHLDTLFSFSVIQGKNAQQEPKKYHQDKDEKAFLLKLEAR